MNDQQELKEAFADVAAEYAKLLVLAECAEERAANLGETGMVHALHNVCHEVTEALRGLAHEVASRTV